MNSLTRAKRHRISLTAPRQPRKPISMVRAPTPMRMYAPFFREGDEVSVRARTGKKKLTTDKYNTCHHLENCFYIHIIVYRLLQRCCMEACWTFRQKAVSVCLLLRKDFQSQPASLHYLISWRTQGNSKQVHSFHNFCMTPANRC